MPSLLESAKRQLTLSTHRVHTMPVVVLMPHSRCNCRCVMCDIWKANVNGTEITAEQLEPHMEAFRELGVKWVTLSGGEALMHRNLWALCCQLEQQLGARITLLSTGLLLKKYAAEVVRWCDEVIVSLDGSREVHNAIRRIPRAYERLVEGVQALRERDRAYRVTGRCVVQRQNYADLPNIIASAQEIGLDEISFLAADVSTTAFNRPQLWGDDRVDEVALSPNEVAHFREVLEEVFERFAGAFAAGYVAESPEKMRRLAHYFAALNGDGEFPPVKCNAPWVSTVIEADGTVRPCFFHEELGNVHEQSLPEILNGEKALAFRRNLDMEQDPICRKCVCTLHLGPRAEI